MAINTYTDLSGLQDAFFVGYKEKLEDNVDVFNANSMGALKMNMADIVSNLPSHAFWSTYNAVSRRDIASTGAITKNGASRGVEIRPVVSRNIADYQQVSALKLDGSNQMEYMMHAGMEAAQYKMKDCLDTAMAAAIGASQDDTLGTFINDSGSSNTLTTTRLLALRALYGDNLMGAKVAFMHSSAYYSLLGNVTSNTTESISDLGRGVFRDSSVLKPYGLDLIVTDSPSLVQGSDYNILLVKENGIQVSVDDTVSPIITYETDQENIEVGYRGEYNVEVAIRGASYTSTANPLNATLSALANWSQVASDVKNFSCVCLKVDA